MVIKSFRHKGLRRLFETGGVSGVQARDVKRLRLQLAALDSAQTIEDMDIPGFRRNRPVSTVLPRACRSGSECLGLNQ